MSTYIQKQQILQKAKVNNGHDTAYLTRESDPDGLSTEHQIVSTGRLIDLLHEQSQINTLQHQAGTILRDLYEQARLSMGQLGRADNFGTCEGSIRRNEEVWPRYKACMKQLGQWWPVLRLSVIEDRHPSEYGHKHNCHGPGALRMALDKLIRHFGLERRAR